MRQDEYFLVIARGSRTDAPYTLDIFFIWKSPASLFTCFNVLKSECFLNCVEVVATVSCPHCHQIIDSQALTCPYCRTALKAYGHPGIPLHRASKNEYLCDSCTYHADNTCNFPQRPYAKECTLYQNIAERESELAQQGAASSWQETVKNWLKRHQPLLLILGLLFICLLIAVSTS